MSWQLWMIKKCDKSHRMEIVNYWHCRWVNIKRYFLFPFSLTFIAFEKSIFYFCARIQIENQIVDKCHRRNETGKIKEKRKILSFSSNTRFTFCSSITFFCCFIHPPRASFCFLTWLEWREIDFGSNVVAAVWYCFSVFLKRTLSTSTFAFVLSTFYCVIITFFMSEFRFFIFASDIRLFACFKLTEWVTFLLFFFTLASVFFSSSFFMMCVSRKPRIRTNKSTSL